MTARRRAAVVLRSVSHCGVRSEMHRGFDSPASRQAERGRIAALRSGHGMLRPADVRAAGGSLSQLKIYGARPVVLEQKAR